MGFIDRTAAAGSALPPALKPGRTALIRGRTQELYSATVSAQILVPIAQMFFWIFSLCSRRQCLEDIFEN